MNTQRRKLVGAIGIAALTGSRVLASDRDQFVGVYKLSAQIRRAKDGTETSTGSANPVGRIAYDKSGRVFTMIAPPGRKPAKDPRNVTPEEYKEIETGLLAYFGTYEVDEAKHIVTIHIEAAANPALTGTTIVRPYEFSGNKLTMIVPGDPEARIVWERLPD